MEWSGGESDRIGLDWITLECVDVTKRRHVLDWASGMEGMPKLVLTVGREDCC
jgi:hypothetical protein